MAHALSCLFTFLLFTGCGDFLDEQPKSDFTNEATVTDSLVSKYKTLDDASAELQGAYEDYKTDTYQFEIFRIGDVQSDNCFIGGDGVPDSQYDLLAMTSTNSCVSLVWSNLYALAGSATNVIENLKLMSGAGIDNERRNEMIAEAKFMRACGATHRWCCSSYRASRRTTSTSITQSCTRRARRRPTSTGR